MNQPLGSVTLDAARAVLARARLAREDFMADSFTVGICGRRQWLMLWHLEAFMSFDRHSNLGSSGQIRQYMCWFQGSLMI